MTAGCKKYIGASQFIGSSLVVLQHFRSQGRQSVVKTGGGKRGGGLGDGSPQWGPGAELVGSAPGGDLGAKPPEANRYYLIKFEFWVQLHRCVINLLSHLKNITWKRKVCFQYFVTVNWWKCQCHTRSLKGSQHLEYTSNSSYYKLQLKFQEKSLKT